MRRVGPFSLRKAGGTAGQVPPPPRRLPGAQPAGASNQFPPAAAEEPARLGPASPSPSPPRPSGSSRLSLLLTVRTWPSGSAWGVLSLCPPGCVTQSCACGPSVMDSTVGFCCGARSCCGSVLESPPGKPWPSPTCLLCLGGSSPACFSGEPSSPWPLGLASFPAGGGLPVPPRETRAWGRLLGSDLPTPFPGPLWVTRLMASERPTNGPFSNPNIHRF